MRRVQVLCIELPAARRIRIYPRHEEATAGQRQGLATTVQADLMIEMVTRISIYSRRVLSAQDGNPRNKNEFSLFKSWAEVHLQKTLKF